MVRFAVPGADQRLHALVVALDDHRTPMAETWRAVGVAASELGLRRPGYHTIRLLVRRVRAARAAAAESARAALEVLAAVPSPYVVDLRRALTRLRDARTRAYARSRRREPP